MNIHFKLLKQGAGAPVIVLKVYDGRFEGRFCKISTGLKIEASDWDKRKERAKQVISKAKEYQSLNQRLDELQQYVINFRSKNHNAKKLGREELRAFVNKSQIDEKPDEGLNDDGQNVLFTTWQHIIDTTKTKNGESIAANTRKSKMQTLELIRKFCVKRAIQFTLDIIDIAFYHDFDGYMKEQNLSGSSRGKHFKEIKAIMREAIDRDYKVNLAFQKKSFKVIRSEPDSVFLNEVDIKKLLALKTLAPHLERMRDVFVMACFVGARHSDWPQVNLKNISLENGKEILKIKQQKTGDAIHVPVHPVVRMILHKYGDSLPKIISNQKFNEGIKLVCETAKLGTATINNQPVDKWREVSTHTARRSFATNAYLSKSMDVYQIMKCTGHKTEASFLRYLKLSGKDFAIQAADSGFFTNTSYTMGIAS